MKASSLLDGRLISPRVKRSFQSLVLLFMAAAYNCKTIATHRMQTGSTFVGQKLEYNKSGQRSF
jgi:hypothetical protein